MGFARPHYPLPAISLRAPGTATTAIPANAELRTPQALFPCRFHRGRPNGFCAAVQQDSENGGQIRQSGAIRVSVGTHLFERKDLVLRFNPDSVHV
jgi:hypothetical protein